MFAVLCEVCRQRPACVHFTECDVQLATQSLDICHHCLVRLGIDPEQPPPLASIERARSPSRRAPAEPELVCGDCGLDRELFLHDKRFGCARCYQVFAEDVVALLEGIHQSSHHLGRHPGAESESMAGEQRLRERLRLQEQLDQAVAAEDFERAAHLRDRLQEFDNA